MKGEISILMSIITIVLIACGVCGEPLMTGDVTRIFPEKPPTVRLSLDYYYEKVSTEDSIVAGEYDGRIGGGCRISNKAGSGSSLQNISITLTGNNFSKPAYEKFATWDPSNIRWAFPQNRILNPGEDLSGMYWSTDQYKKTDFPFNITREVSPGEFTLDGIQDNNYTVMFNPSDATEYYGLITVYDDAIADTGIVNGSFWTDIPLKDYAYKEYYDDAVDGNRTTLSYHIDPASLVPQKLYHLGFAVDISTKYPGAVVKIRPRFYLSKEHRVGKLTGETGMKGQIPKEYLKESLTSMTGETNKSVKWEYSQIIFTKLSYKRETSIGGVTAPDLYPASLFD